MLNAKLILDAGMTLCPHTLSGRRCVHMVGVQRLQTALPQQKKPLIVISSRLSSKSICLHSLKKRWIRAGLAAVHGKTAPPRQSAAHPNPAHFSAKLPTLGEISASTRGNDVEPPPP